MGHIRKIVLLGFFCVVAGAGDRADAQTYRDCPQCPTMVVIPAGSIIIGPAKGEHDWAVSQGGKAEWYKNEKPAHRVTIRRSFSIGKYEVTRALYADFVWATGHASSNCLKKEGDKMVPDPDRNWINPGFKQTDLDPVVCVSWDDAQAYVRWLSRITGKDYRLPSEAEWEYAARAGKRTMRYWGDDKKNTEACGYANAADLTAKDEFPDWTTFSCRDGYVYTAPVGRFRPNAYGLHDMLGNVWEWTQDCYHDSYEGAPTDGSAWMSGDCARRVNRGGAWGSFPRCMRAANRVRNVPCDRCGYVGIRVARTN
jgi:sulfatase modifying factor 1